MQSILPDEFFEKFRAVIYDQSGIHFSESNRPILESRLRERLRISGMDHVSEYLKKITSDQGEMKTFLDSITTNLTRFFRNSAHFESFRKHVIPDLIEQKKKDGSKKIKLWSAGCSTGEEPYSLAMVLKDLLPYGYDFEITASDLSLKSLLTANQAFYPAARMSGVPEDYKEKYFIPTGEGFQVRPEIKNHIKFDYHNLKFDSGLTDLDAVFCRNVLIYFDEAAQKNVIDLFYKAMSKHSYLYIGHSESLFGMETKFEFLKTEWAVLYTKMVDRNGG
jgi:chemotaxis protein methyltransferase CheR